MIESKSQGERGIDTGRPSSAPVGAGGPLNVIIPISGDSDVGSARRAANKIGMDAGMSETEAGSISLVVTEAARNIARYGGEGSIMLRLIDDNRQPMVEMIAIDKGPGIGDMSRAMSDGFSTGGTPGKGLGAIRRLSSEFDIWSSSTCGTVVVSRIAIASRKAESDVASIGVVCSPLRGETECGDAWMIDTTANGFIVALVDGLGHGPEAAVAADTAIAVIRRKRNSTLDEMLRSANDACKPTRGAAVQIATISTTSRTIVSAGVGNISASINTGGGSKSIPSQPGIVGHQMSRVREQTLPWSADSLLAMHSDGLSARWRLDSYPGLRLRDPAIIAAVLYRDFMRGRDDATILMVRSTNSSGARVA